ncbi:MAG: Na(+)-translocating NADH-quinone reductase subunit C [Rubinisphaera brasiliensis]|uniref:Na(+)-translocating NADH-quinone reductase subunit C n=1 Tax=Rubinisphaera brasiliensis (strain ATCC 49424 / DSM 5305 / JCM 21570 / IAM 15109 / NBRC 103401 / IFAM 1448) TaxID=756272 RepID=F0SRP2_RUBBR|nr:MULTISPECIES: Na(+)-translocating NADH-quinone reductase subunit C [Rubinisphaera]ADY59165.1 NADH:ubiquinone oxidoreductase, subunit C [Rubinisphaera brasiliensis DSM 5305]MBB02628.1 NADH:ubiquinone reductase (Na(+)-transporting) subunit C [Planctomyces sp.]MBR9803947.1 Na(+)-translocating NADH-quinone reductase subunit C [bacterium]
MFQRDTIGGTFAIAAVLCVVCSVVVSATAVGLRPIKNKNEKLSFQREVLTVAGLYNKDENKPGEIPELFKSVDPVLVNIDDAKVADTDKVSVDTFDLKAVSVDPDTSMDIPDPMNLAGINRREKYTMVYIVKKDDGSLDQIILPVRGKGLWSTMWGLLSLDSDGETVRGLTFYQDGETPGLGGEINNPKWKATWSNPECPKVLYDEKGNVAISFVKGAVTCDTENSEHKFEALAGATITTRGVENMLKYWMGDHGYGPLLEKVKEGQFPDTKTASR